MHMCLQGWGMFKLFLGSYLDIVQENKVFFNEKIGQKVPQMALVQLDQGAILDKSFWIMPFTTTYCAFLRRAKPKI
jgi:hypothetical protein